MFFRYFLEVASEAGKKAIYRVLDANVQTWLDAKVEDGSAKYAEVTFQEWWEHAVAEDTKTSSLEGADEGEFWTQVEDTQNPGSVVTIACSLETGEPVDEEAASAPVEAQAASEGTEAPEAPADAASESSEPAAEAPAPSEDGQPEQSAA